MENLAGGTSRCSSWRKSTGELPPRARRASRPGSRKSSTFAVLRSLRCAWHDACDRSARKERTMAVQAQPERKRLYDVEQVRRRAQESIERGAVTKDYPLDLERTYELLNQALA